MRKTKKGDEAEPAIVRVEKVIDTVLAAQGQELLIPMSSAMRDLRAALDAAAKANSWDLVELSFARATSLGVEMLVRSQLEMREHLRRHDESGGASRRYPDIAASAERLERIVNWILDVAGRYGRVRHLVDISRRRLDDPKIVPIERESAAPGKRANTRKKRKVGSRA